MTTRAATVGFNFNFLGMMSMVETEAMMREVSGDDEARENSFGWRPFLMWMSDSMFVRAFSWRFIIFGGISRCD